ncbi:hypothetical protein GCM10009826_31230 [Humibacillus xanthopallidus]
MRQRRAGLGGGRADHGDGDDRNRSDVNLLADVTDFDQFPCAPGGSGLCLR